jgi:hypothetical protein
VLIALAAMVNNPSINEGSVAALKTIERRVAWSAQIRH